MKIFFTDYFSVSPADLDSYGAFNVSLINDLPVFIDPFLLFNSEKSEYQDLHSEIVKYVQFLRDMAAEPGIRSGLLIAWYRFPEVQQNWLGYSRSGNRGSGLGDAYLDGAHRIHIPPVLSAVHGRIRALHFVHGILSDMNNS